MTAGMVPITRSMKSLRASVSRDSVPRARSKSSPEKYTSSASNEAVCSMTSKASAGFSQPNNAGTSTRWPDEEIGTNSVRPCTAPSTMASIKDTVAEHKRAYIGAR
jgi:hypothetical protein